MLGVKHIMYRYVILLALLLPGIALAWTQCPPGLSSGWKPAVTALIILATFLCLSFIIYISIKTCQKSNIIKNKLSIVVIGILLILLVAAVGFMGMGFNAMGCY